MITRELPDGRSILIRQEDHADLSAQFASQWGNASFAPPHPYRSVVAAAAYHDTHFRDIEFEPHIDIDHGRPFGHRTLPFSATHLEALRQNIKWLHSHDPYAELLVSMHHTGLLQNRYGVINSWQNDYGNSSRLRQMRPEVSAVVRELEEDQRVSIQSMTDSSLGGEERVRKNYRLMQVFDLLALYLCCDGYAGDEMKAAMIGPIPDFENPNQDIDLHIVPKSRNVLSVDPFPFRVTPLQVSLVVRIMPPLVGRTEAECLDEVLRAPREHLSWTITS